MRKRKWQRPKSLESESDCVGDPNPRTLIQSLVQSVNLAEQPIEEPQFEKSRPTRVMNSFCSMFV